MIYVGGFLEPGKDYRTVSLDSTCPFNQPVLGRVDQQDTGLGTPIIYLLVGWRGCLPLLCLALSYLPRGEPITLYPNSHYWRYYYISLVLYLLNKLNLIGNEQKTLSVTLKPSLETISSSDLDGVSSLFQSFSGHSQVTKCCRAIFITIIVSFL